MAKIVHITTVHPELDIRIFQKQCRTLARAGHEVALIAPRDGAERAGKCERIEGVDIYALPKAKSRLRRMFCTTRLAVREALRLEADLYHLHDPELLPFARRLRRGGRAAVVYDMHENLPKDLLHKPWLPRLFRRPAAIVASLAERVILVRLSVVLAEDSYAADRKWLRDFTIVRNMPLVEELLAAAAEAEKIAAADEMPQLPSPPAVGYMGSISPARGSLVMLAALGILREQGIRCALELVGPMYDDRAKKPLHARELEQKAASLGLDAGVVRRSGWLPAQDAWRRIAPCRVGLAVLQDRPNFRDSLPTKILEYMALGLPVVVSDFPLYRQIVESAGCGLCVDAADPQAIAAALARLLTNPAEAAALGRRGREAVLARYRWDVESRKLLTLYERLLR